MKNQFISFIVSNVDHDAIPAPTECVEALQNFDLKSLQTLAALIEAAQTEESYEN